MTHSGIIIILSQTEDNVHAFCGLRFRKHDEFSSREKAEVIIGVDRQHVVQRDQFQIVFRNGGILRKQFLVKLELILFAHEEVEEQFKADHWDYERGHLQQEYLDEFYQLWHDSIAAKLGVPQNETPPAVASAPVTLPSHKEATTPSASPAGKRKRSTGSITYKDSIQTSLFE